MSACAANSSGDNSSGDQPPARLDFRLLGPLEVRVQGRLVEVSGRRCRVVLVMLLLEPDRLITVGRLIKALWDDLPPKTAEAQVQICVSQLRSRLAEAGVPDLIHTCPTGYLIRVPDNALDVARFRRLVARARAAAGDGDLPAAAGQLRAALELWRGDLTAEVDSQLVQAAALRLSEERLAVTQEWIGIELTLGRGADHIGRLRELVATYPLQEKLHAQLALALYRCGRQAEALEACRAAKQVLVGEHGIDPSEELRQLERSILDNDPALAAPAPQSTVVIPRQLPAPPSDFVGRGETVAGLCSQLLPDSTANPGQVPVVAISGPAGVGKTALAVRVAHLLRAHFPDGQLFAYLRGTDAMALPPEQLLNQFLRALGGSPAMLPTDIHELAAAYRSRLAGNRVLILVDDAVSEAQVRPLIPGDSGCALIVTSRRELAGLAGAHRLDLPGFDANTSRALLERMVGPDRVRAEPEPAAALAEVCGHLPLALRVVAAKLSTRTHWRLGQMVSRLNDERRRLDELTLDDFGVRPSISISYRGLPPRAARLLMLLSTLGATDFGSWVASPLLDLDVATAMDLLDELVDARLVEVEVGAGHHTRYRLDPHARLFALELLPQQMPATESVNAQRRLLRCWLFMVRRARARISADHCSMQSGVEPWALPEDVVDELMGEPMRWLDVEYANLVAAVDLAAKLGNDELCWDLAVSSVPLFETRAYYDAWRDTHETAMHAVQRTGNRRGAAMLCYSRGALALAEKRLSAAKRDLRRALEWFESEGNTYGRGRVLLDLASIDRLTGRYDTAAAGYEAALADLRSVGDRVAQASVLRRLAQIQLDQGQPGEAETRLREALAVCAGPGGQRTEAQIRYRLGQALLANGKPVEAESAFRTVLRAVEQSGDVVGRANALLGAGMVHLVRGDLDRAGAALSEAWEAARGSGSRLAEGQTLLAQADLQHRRGAPGKAVTLLDNAEAIFGEIGATAWMSQTCALRHRVTGTLPATGGVAGPLGSRTTQLPTSPEAAAIPHQRRPALLPIAPR